MQEGHYIDFGRPQMKRLWIALLLLVGCDDPVTSPKVVVPPPPVEETVPITVVVTYQGKPLPPTLISHSLDCQHEGKVPSEVLLVGEKGEVQNVLVHASRGSSA